MDKIMKVEIEKVMCNLYECALFKLNNIDKKKDVDSATSAFNALIIKWLEERKYDCYSENGAPVEMDNFEANAYAKGVVKGRNQLITELIGELR